LSLIEQAGITPHRIEYLKTIPSVDELARLLDLLQMTPREIMRHKEAEYRALGLDDPTLDRTQLLQALHDHPRLLERPIVVRDDKRAVLARPPERVLELLKND
jgi:arsenate reductase